MQSEQISDRVRKIVSVANARSSDYHDQTEYYFAGSCELLKLLSDTGVFPFTGATAGERRLLVPSRRSIIHERDLVIEHTKKSLAELSDVVAGVAYKDFLVAAVRKDLEKLESQITVQPSSSPFDLHDFSESDLFNPHLHESVKTFLIDQQPLARLRRGIIFGTQHIQYLDDPITIDNVTAVIPLGFYEHDFLARLRANVAYSAQQLN
jgi:hypothetical protein